MTWHQFRWMKEKRFVSEPTARSEIQIYFRVILDWANVLEWGRQRARKRVREENLRFEIVFWVYVRYGIAYSFQPFHLHFGNAPVLLAVLSQQDLTERKHLEDWFGIRCKIYSSCSLRASSPFARTGFQSGHKAAMQIRRLCRETRKHSMHTNQCDEYSAQPLKQTVYVIISMGKQAWLAGWGSCRTKLIYNSMIIRTMLWQAARNELLMCTSEFVLCDCMTLEPAQTLQQQ